MISGNVKFECVNELLMNRLLLGKLVSGISWSYIRTFMCWNGNVNLGEHTAQSRRNI